MAAPHSIDPILTEAEIAARVRALGDEITKAFADTDTLLCVGLLNGAFVFLADLVRAIDLPVEIDFMRASSYTTGTAPGALHIFGDLATDIGDRDVLVVDDILSTGNTLSAVMARLATRWPRRLEACVLIDKPVLRQVPVDVRWTGFAKPDAFYVGYGMDYDQRHRNRPDIGAVRFAGGTS
jgi:hypoxanthine phosphoribosyltransferase